jgi:phosphate transport system ATP-binding protein
MEIVYKKNHEKGSIDVENLSVYYGDFHALKNVNMRIHHNAITAFIGPSGCGKSTFLKCLNRMNDYVDGCKIEGSITLDEKNIYSKYDVNYLRKKVGMVFQKPNPFAMSIYDNITFGPKTHGNTDGKKYKKSELDEMVERYLYRVGLWDEVKDKLHKSALGLSGGQQQRLCIARAIATSPEVLLMDEPTSALDPKSTEIIEQLCVELKERYSVVMVTHNMQQARRIADYTAFFYVGELIEYGDTDQIFDNPAQLKTKDYVQGQFG